MENVNANTIYLKQMELGPMQNFVYLVGDPQTRECVVVDPAWGIDTIVEDARAHPRPRGVARAREGEGARPQGRVSVPQGLRLRPRAGGQPRHAQGWPAHPDLPAHARPHPGLPVLPRRRAADLGGHALHRLVRTHRSPGERPDGDVLLAHAAARRAPRGHDPVPRPQLWRSLLDDRRREAAEPLHALHLARRLLTD